MSRLRVFQVGSLIAGLLLSSALKEPRLGPASGRGSLPAPPSAASTAMPEPAAPGGQATVAPAAPPIPMDGRVEAPLSPDPAPSSEPARQDAYDLWRRWLRLVEQRAYQQIPIANAMLAESLRSGGGAEIYQEVANLLRDGNLLFQIRSQLVELLGEIATPEALALLLDLADQGMESPMYAPALNTISHIGENRWGGRFHEELSPLLEQTWKSMASSDWPYLVAVTRAIVGIGAPSGIALLLDALASRDAAPSSNRESRGKRVAAFTETPKVTNPAAVSVLKGAVIGAGASNPTGARSSRPEPGSIGNAALVGGGTYLSSSLAPAESTAPSIDPSHGADAAGPAQAAPGGDQPALLPVVVNSLENIGSEAALNAIQEISLNYPEAKRLLSEPAS